MQTKAYSDYLANIGGLIGVPTSRISTELADALEVYFNAAMRKAWKAGNWLDICPYGEARFAGNKLTYPNDLSQTANWTATALTITANNLANPLDGRTTASKCMETAANSAHQVVQSSLTFFPNTDYLVSVYARQNGRDDIKLTLNDGTTSHSAFYDINAGTVGTASNTSGTTCTPVANGFFLCQLEFTTGSTAGSGSLTINLSTDGSTTSYAGDTGKGVYLWGALVQQTSNTGPQDALVAWSQTGEDTIDAVFTVWKDPPSVSYYPREQPFELTPNGLQIVSTGTGLLTGAYTTAILYGATANPVYLYYRKAMPSYTGDTFSASSTYTAGQQVYYTASDGNSNFYKCLAATSAGEDPDDTPSKWDLLEIPEPLFWFATYQAYGDWLTADGQQDKAVGAYALAQGRMDDAWDVQERQMGWVMPTRFATHVTAQVRF